MNPRTGINPRKGWAIGIAACLVASLSATGCHGAKKDPGSARYDQYRGKMYYRGVPKAAPESNSISVGRQGRDMESDRWNERGAGNSGEWNDAPTAVGRYGRSSESSVWARTSTGGEPVDHGAESSVYGSRGGSDSEVGGSTASSGEGTERGAEAGNIP